MKQSSRYNAQLLWYAGNALVILIVLGIPLTLLIIMKLLDLYEMPDPFDQLGVPKFMVLTGLTIFTVWIHVSNWWKKRAMQLVTEEDKYQLIEKFEDEERSFVLKKWEALSKRGKFIRVAVITVIICAAIYGEHYFAAEDRQFQQEGVSTVATIKSVRTTYKRKNLKLLVTYQYAVGQHRYEDEKTIKSGWFLMKEVNGFVVVEGDEFELQYLQSDPTKNRLQSDKPLGKTVRRYVSLTAGSLEDDHPDRNYCQCLAQQTFDTFGIDGLARLFHRHDSYWDNDEFNTIKYEQLTKKPAFKEIEELCRK